jgi:uncharacterized radical SAM superfamily protein
MDLNKFKEKINNGESFSSIEAEKIFFNEKISNILIQEASLKYFNRNFENQIKLFYPGNKFPSISITDEKCQLNCSHCNAKYLKQMIPLSKYRSIVELSVNLEENGALGLLISGGCDIDGRVPIYNYLEELKEIKSKTSLILNLHTGLVDNKTTKLISEMGVDAISFDIICDNEIIKNVLNLNKTCKDYAKSLALFKKYNLKNVFPHICLGLNKGIIKNEFKALKLLKNYNPDLIVIILFTPTKSTVFEKINTVPLNLVQRFFSLVRLMFPKTELSLGCMRPRRKIKNEIDLAALQSGFNRIVIPSKILEKYLKKKNITIKKYHGCCCIPKYLISKFEWKN